MNKTTLAFMLIFLITLQNCKSCGRKLVGLNLCWHLISKWQARMMPDDVLCMIEQVQVVDKLDRLTIDLPSKKSWSVKSQASKSCDIVSFVIESVFINVSLRCIGNEVKKNQYLIYCKRCPCQLIHLRVSPFMSIDHSHVCILLWIKHKLHLKQCPHFYYGLNKFFPYKFTFQGRITTFDIPIEIIWLYILYFKIA